MSLESFYGGKQGVSPVVKARFKYVDTNDPAYLKQIEKGLSADSLKSEVMDACFADVSYKDVWYGQLAIIDTTNKRNPNNGKLFRRVLPRTESEAAVDGGTLHGEYIGRIVGPSEGYPKIRFGSIDNIITQIDKDGNGSVSDKAIEYSFPTEDGIVDTDKFDEVVPADLEANKENNQLISGLNENSIHYSWVNVRNNIDGEDQESYVYLGFQIPYTYFDFNFNAIDWRNDSLSHNWDRDNEIAYKNGSQPFYQKRTFGIPRGVRGNGVGSLTRTTFGKFINSGKEGATEILYNFKDLYEESTGKFDIKDYQGNYPQFEEDNLTEDSAILVYTFYMYDSTYDNDDKTKIVTCYFGKITDIENIELDDDGSFRIKYSSGESYTFDKKIKWIKNVELVEPGDRYLTNIPSQLQLTYNDDTISQAGIVKMIDSIQWTKNRTTQLMDMEVKYTTALNNGSNPWSRVEGSSFKSIDDIRIDSDSKEIQYHVWPNFNGYMKFNNDGVYLNAIEQIFVGSDGHLYVKYSSSKYRYDGSDGSVADPSYIPHTRYRYVKDDGSIWYKGGDLPDSIGTSEENWMWWQDLGIVKQTVGGVRIATDLNIARHNAYREAIGQVPLDWENFDIDDILDVLNSSWEVNGKEVNPYINGHIYLYQIGQEADLNADPIEDRMGELIFYKDKQLSFFFDFQGQSDDAENKRGWKYAGPWSSSDASMQLKIKNGENVIPDDEQMHRKGFYFNVDLDKNSEIELTEFWS